MNELFYVWILLSLKNWFGRFCWIWKYSKTKIGHNFLPGLVSSNLNTDLNLSVLRKKVISKLKILWTYDTFLILISGRCSWREDVSTTSTKLAWCNVNDVDTTQHPRAWWDVTWRDVTSTASSIGGRLRSDFMANPAKIFITIQFESYIVVNQTF